MAGANRRWGQRLSAAVFLCALILAVLTPATAANRAGTREHVDWPESCITAYNLIFTEEEYTAAVSEGTLEAVVLCEAGGRILYGPDRLPQEGGFVRVDLESLPAEAEPGVYPVGLYLFPEDDAQDYITVRLTIKEPPAPSSAPSPTLTPVPAETPAPLPPPAIVERPAPAPAPEPISTETPAPTAEPVESAIPTPVPQVTEEPVPEQETPFFPEHMYLVVFGASIVAAAGLWLPILPQIGVVRWHKKMREKARKRTAEDWEREERDG